MADGAQHCEITEKYPDHYRSRVLSFRARYLHVATLPERRTLNEDRLRSKAVRHAWYSLVIEKTKPQYLQHFKPLIINRAGLCVGGEGSQFNPTMGQIYEPS